MKESIEGLIGRICGGERAALAKGITMVEREGAEGQDLVRRILPLSGRSVRVAVTGAPGAGKSTFIESLGMLLIARGHRVAVLTIDPSSTVTGGSILGDKTRMEQLSRSEQAFIRPSPSGGHAGGVTKGTRESILLCEAAGYDIVLIETVGVGQSETAVRDMTDLFLLLVIAGAGDELQGIKKGIMELADLVVVNKADGENIERVAIAQAQLQQALHITGAFQDSGPAPVLTCSALEGTGIGECADRILGMADEAAKDGRRLALRKAQEVKWLDEMITAWLFRVFLSGSDFAAQKVAAAERIRTGSAGLFDEFDRLTQRDQ